MPSGSAANGSQLPITSFFGGSSSHKRKADRSGEGATKPAKKKLKHKENTTPRNASVIDLTAGDVEAAQEKSHRTPSPPPTKRLPLSPRRRRGSSKQGSSRRGSSSRVGHSDGPSLLDTPGANPSIVPNVFQVDTAAPFATPLNNPLARTRAAPCGPSLPTPPPTILKSGKHTCDIGSNAGDPTTNVGDMPSLGEAATIAGLPQTSFEPMTPRSPARHGSFTPAVSTPQRSMMFNSQQSPGRLHWMPSQPGSPNQVVPSSQTFPLDSQTKFVSLTEALENAKETMKHMSLVPKRLYSLIPDPLLDDKDANDDDVMFVPSSQTQELTLPVDPMPPRNSSVSTETKPGGTGRALSRAKWCTTPDANDRPVSRDLCNVSDRSDSSDSLIVPSSQGLMEVDLMVTDLNISNIGQPSLLPQHERHSATQVAESSTLQVNVSTPHQLDPTDVSPKAPSSQSLHLMHRSSPSTPEGTHRPSQKARGRREHTSQPPASPLPQIGEIQGISQTQSEVSVTESESEDPVVLQVRRKSQPRSSQSIKNKSQKKSRTLTETDSTTESEEGVVGPGVIAERDLQRDPSMPGIVASGLQLSNYMRKSMSQQDGSASETETESEPDVSIGHWSHIRKSAPKAPTVASSERTVVPDLAAAVPAGTDALRQRSPGFARSQAFEDDEQSMVSDTPLEVPSSWEDTGTQSGDLTDSQFAELDPAVRNFLSMHQRGPL